MTFTLLASPLSYMDKAGSACTAVSFDDNGPSEGKENIFELGSELEIIEDDASSNEGACFKKESKDMSEKEEFMEDCKYSTSSGGRMTSKTLAA